MIYPNSLSWVIYLESKVKVVLKRAYFAVGVGVLKRAHFPIKAEITLKTDAFCC